jgi:molecular chaperone GrpE
MEVMEQVTEQADAGRPPAGEAVQNQDDIQAEAEPQWSVQALQAELDKAQAQAAEYLDGWQRSRAEFANYKKRVEAEREEWRRTSNEALLLRLLPVVDDFERAFQKVPPEWADSPWVSGINMILRKLHVFLESQGVVPIQAAGQSFDPQQHEAVLQEETAEHPDGAVIAEIQRGYRLGERVLRPAQVKVATNTQKEQKPNG